MDPLQAITLAGAAGALLWVLKLIIDGKLHADSEVQGLRADKLELQSANKALRDANAEVAALLRDILGLLQGEEEVRR